MKIYNLRFVTSATEAILNPSMHDLLRDLNQIRNINGASARLEFIPEPEIGPSELTLHIDGKNSKYLITLLVYTEDGGSIVKTPPASKNEKEALAIFEPYGEFFPSNSIVRDFSVVEKSFLDFLENGDISFFE